MSFSAEVVSMLLLVNGLEDVATMFLAAEETLLYGLCINVYSFSA